MAQCPPCLECEFLGQFPDYRARGLAAKEKRIRCL